MKLTKAIFYTGIFIAWAFLVALFITGFLIANKNNSSNLISRPGSQIQENGSLSDTIGLTLQEIEKHNKATDCWMIINNKVYDITSYIGSHPGGYSTIVSGCGKDATELYDTKGNRGSPHSANANSLLDAYFIGDLNTNLTVSEIGNKTSSIKQSPPTRSRNDDD
ncbi:Cytochrome b5-like Heme/Steroid binding domain protein [uncultured archaeon]|nr:Cytochrome b5-like Heme/Steroid binding domain protein [uncultured archaeon]